jgi:hypothetical protein
MEEKYSMPQKPQRHFFQQDGASPKYTSTTNNFLNEQFPHKWSETGGYTACPPRSPSWNSLEFLFMEAHEGQ